MVRVVAMLAVVGGCGVEAAGLSAFPGAEGYGAETPGGRGGRVVWVTNTDDAGPGSLRQAMEVETGTGTGRTWPASPYPVLAPGTPPTDTDRNGMPDEWEKKHHLDPKNASDGPAVTRSGYTNVENYLNELAGDAVVF